MAKVRFNIKSRQYIFSFVWEIFKIVVISLAIIVPIRYFLFQPFFVKGVSMESSFNDGEYLIIDEISYRFHDPAREDVIVFRYPKDPTQYYIKRVIGLPGETVKIEGGNIVIFNQDNPQGFILNEPYLSEENKFTSGNLETHLDENDYFVLGDNRRSSSDSRIWGPVPRHYIIGRAWLRAWPFNRVGILK